MPGNMTSFAIKLLHPSLSWHSSSPQFTLSWGSTLPWRCSLALHYPPASFAGVASLRTCLWPSALFSQFSLQCLIQSHSFHYFLSTVDSKIYIFRVCPLFPASEPNFHLLIDIPIGLCCHHLYHQRKLWLPKWYHHLSPQSYRVEVKSNNTWYKGCTYGGERKNSLEVSLSSREVVRARKCEKCRTVTSWEGCKE